MLQLRKVVFNNPIDLGASAPIFLCLFGTRKYVWNMKKAKQIKAMGPCLHGYTMPVGAIYGTVKGTDYWYNPEKQQLWVYADAEGPGIDSEGGFAKYNRKAAQKYWPGIMSIIKDFMRSPEYDANMNVIYCQHWQKKDDKAFHKKKAQAEIAADRRMGKLRGEQLSGLNSVTPKEKKPQVNFDYRAWSQSCVDGAGYSIDYEYEVPQYYIPFLDGTDAFQQAYTNPEFEKGQTTAGDLQFERKEHSIIPKLRKEEKNEKRKKNERRVEDIPNPWDGKKEVCVDGSFGLVPDDPDRFNPKPYGWFEYYTNRKEDRVFTQDELEMKAGEYVPECIRKIREGEDYKPIPDPTPEDLELARLRVEQEELQRKILQARADLGLGN